MDERIKALRQERTQRIITTLKNEKADRIPSVAWRADYLVYYYGYTMSQIDSHEKMLEIFKRADQDFDFTVCDPIEPIGLTYPVKESICAGSMYRLNDDGNAVQIDPSLIEIMKPDEYDAFNADTLHYLADVCLPRRYGILSPDMPKEEKFARLKQLDEVAARSGAFRRAVWDQTALVGSAHIFYGMPVDVIFDFLRNFTGIILDIRRQPQKLIEACEILEGYTIKDIKSAPVIPGSSATCALHLAPFLKAKDFEKVYWPSFRRIIEATHECGHSSKLLFEKSWKHVFDFLDDLPVNSVCGYFEKEDGFENVCKRLGDHMIIAGGIETELLARGTVEENVNQIKRIIDECCQDGGVFLAPDLPMVYKVDGNPENYKAVMDTIRDYGTF